MHTKKQTAYLLKKLALCTLLLGLLGLVVAYQVKKPIWYPNDIMPINSLAEVDFNELLKDAPGQDSLIFFDIDDTLTSTNDVAGRSDYSLLFQLHSFVRHPQLINPKTLAYYLSILWKEVPRRLLEPMSIGLVKELEAQNHIVLALTDVSAGSFGVIENFPAWRYDILSNFGFTFSQKFPDTTFCSLPMKNNYHPIIYKGIVCCNSEPKGNVVEALLNHFAPYKPKIIVFFDDRMKNLLSVEASCKKCSIPFKGFHILAKRNLPGTWNMQRAKFQFKYLLKHEHWISDQEADDMMAKKHTGTCRPCVPNETTSAA